MRSNYFPDDKNRYHVGSAAVYKADIMGSPSTTFPKSKLALWDRSPVGAWIEISTAGAAPLLALHREWCLALVKPAHASTTAFAHLCCQLVPRSSVEGFSSPVVGGGEQVLSVEAVDAGEAGRMPSPQQTTGPPRDSLRVPIQYRSEPGFAASAPFDSEDTSALMENLARSVQSCKSLSLKSFMRIRGVAVPRPPYVDCGVRTAGASVRLELVSPDATFCAKPVCDLPVLKTPLSVQVASMHGSGDNPQASGSLFSSRTTGYLTLSKVRQAVLLMETDPDASVIPLVGIWVFVDSPAPEPGGTGSSLRENTLVWAACCRYIYSTLIRERVWVDENTFLMMAIFRNKTIFYEVSASAGFGAVRPSFVCLDFTADINAPTEMTKSDPNNNYVIACRFRPLSNLACIEAFRRSLSNLESTRSVDPASWICPGSADFAPCIAEQTPMPRSLMAMPPPSPPSRHPATRPLEELPHQTQIIKLSLDVMDNGSCSEDGAIALQDNGSQYQQTIYRQAQELEAMRLEIAELTAKLNVNSTQPSAPIEAITHAKQAKKGKKKASRTATLDARGTEPIVSQLSNYLALSKLQKQIEPNPIIKTGLVDTKPDCNPDLNSICNMSDMTADDFPSPERVVLMEPPSMPQFDFINRLKGGKNLDERARYSNHESDNKVVSKRELISARTFSSSIFNVVDSLRSPYVPPIMMIPEPQQEYYVDDSLNEDALAFSKNYISPNKHSISDLETERQNRHGTS